MPTSNITRHPPRIPSLVAPAIDIGLAPVTQGVENCSIHVEKGVTHPDVARKSVGLSPIVARWCRVGQIRTGAVRVISRSIGDTGVVLVCPVGGNAAVVVFEVYTGQNLA